MRGLKVFIGLFAASVSVIAATFLIPATRSFYSSALWISSPDFGTSSEGRLITLSILRSHQQSMTPEEIDQITDLAMRDGRPQVLAMAVRSIIRFSPLPKTKQSNTFASSSKLRSTGLKSLQTLVNKGAKAEPDNSFWPLVQTAVLYNLGQEAKAREALLEASSKPDWQDHAFFEADLRVQLAGRKWGAVSQQIVNQQYASIMLPYYSDFRNAGSLTINRRPIAKSVEDRIAIARIGNQLALQSDNAISIFVGSSLAQMSIAEQTAPKGQILLPDLKGLREEDARTWRQAAAISETSRNFLQSRVFSNSDWSVVDDFRALLALFPSICALLMIFPCAWMIRRFASWRENERFESVVPFLSIGFGGLIFCAAFAFTTGSQMVVPMIVCIVAMGVFGVLAYKLHDRVGWPLILTATALFWSLSYFNHDDGFAYVIGFNTVGALPLICFGVQKAPKTLQQVASWLAWVIWLGLIVITVLNQTAVGVFAMGVSPPEHTLIKSLTLCVGALMGAFGVASFAQPGAKGLWWQASGVQGLALVGLLALIAQCVSIDKTAERLLPAEAQLMAEFREQVQAKLEKQTRATQASLLQTLGVE